MERDMALLIVESPNKIKKISKALPPGYVVMASVGHVMDLEKKDMGIDLDTFDASYKINDDKKDIVKSLKEEAKKHDVIYIATDPDREGEGIAHNIRSLLPKQGKQIIRVAFKDLSKASIQAALQNPVGFDDNLFEAQQARRMTDRLVGFKVSPVMWAKGMKNTSAGRVQSATLKWLVDREKEIRSFVPEEYWSIHSDMINGFTADFYGMDGKKYVPPNKAKADAIVNDIGKELVVSQYNSTAGTRSPSAPFITATLQQDASSKFGWTSKKTMDVAQSLFSNGLITYHRTDSVRIEPAKIKDIRERIEQSYGKAYLSPKARTYQNKDAAQDAHEAIRPTFEPVPTSISVDDKRLLELITNRFMASQMADAKFDKTNVELESKGEKKTYQFRASGSVMQFDGFLKVYGGVGKDTVLPSMKVGDKIKIKKLRPVQHFTKPPGRYTDSSFISKMKNDGVGRPSTYATVVETLLSHGYIVRDKKALKPTEVGIMVSDYLSEFFKDISNAEFTATLESELDDIATGKAKKKDVMKKFFETLSTELQAAIEGDPGVIFKTKRDCPSCKDGSKMVRKVGKHGVFLGCENYPTCGQIMNFDKDGNIKEDKVETGLPCPVCNSKIIKKQGKFGEFYGCSAYPTCKWTGKVDEQGNVITNKKAKKSGHSCPKCNSDLIERDGKFGKFLGCSAYPKCKFIGNEDENGNIVPSKGSSGKKASSAKKTGKSCPKCKTGELLEREGKFGTFLGCSEFPKCKHIEKGK